MEKPQTWRELLGKHLSDPQERQMIAEALSVNPITLIRWSNGESKPRPKSLQRLLNTLPEHHDLLLPLIEEEFNDFSSFLNRETHQEASPTLPSELYARVLHTITTLPKSLLFPSISDLILQQAINQLDPQRLGLAIVVTCCMPLSADGKVQSLRERVGRGTPPWKSSLEQHALLLGAESLAGHVVSACHMESNSRLKDDAGVAPGYRGQWEESAVAVPILHLGKIAGSLLVSSSRSDYFTPERCTLIEQYAELLCLVFDPEDFYELAQIELKVMPSPEIQYPYFSEFRERLMQMMMQAQRNRQPMTLVQAEQVVWHQIEQDLLQQISLSISRT